MEKQVILITGAGSGFGRLTAEALARAGHTVYASMRNTAERGAEFADYAKEHGVDLRTVELDVSSQASADTAIETVMADAGRLDVLMHNAGHMVYGPAEAFTAEQLAQLYDINVLGTQRVNRAALPHMRSAGCGLLIWNSSSSVAGGTSPYLAPYLAPYFAAKAGMDSLAVSYSYELARWGLLTFHTAPRCDPKSCQPRRGAPAAVILRSSPATPDGAILGRNPKGRWLFFRNPALQLAYVARLHRARRALSCEKIAAGAASYETSTDPRHRDLDRGARCVHERHQSFRQRRLAGRYRACRGIRRQRAVSRVR